MTDWEGHYQKGETPWDKAAPAPELEFALREGLLRGSVLVPGCGRGHDVRAILAAGAHEVVGLDLSPTAVAGARALGVGPGGAFGEGDLFQVPGGVRGRFDWVWEHTCFCAIPPALRPDYVRAVHEALRPGGRLLGVFFLDPALEDPKAGPPFGVERAELDAFFEGRFELVAEWAPRAVYAGRGGVEWVRHLRRLD